MGSRKLPIKVKRIASILLLMLVYYFLHPNLRRQIHCSYNKHRVKNLADLAWLNLDTLYTPKLNVTSSESEIPMRDIMKFQNMGLCINFNNDPDAKGNTLTSLLKYYAIIFQYIVIFTPSSFSKLSEINRVILKKYNTSLIDSLLTSSNGHLRLPKLDNMNGNLFHIECTNTHFGYYQYICMSLCAQMFYRLSSQHVTPSFRGVLYLPDDVFFNLSYVLSDPIYYSLDEFWTSPASGLVEGAKGKVAPSGWRWWEYKDNWKIFYHIFFEENKFSGILNKIYGSNRLLSSAFSDVVYIPTADNQLLTFVEVIDNIMTLFPNAFCDVVLTVIVDIASALCRHWPYQHDRRKFKSRVNLLNNKTYIKDMEDRGEISNARNPLNKSEYIRRPCLLSNNAIFWGRDRDSEPLYRKWIFTDTLSINNLSQIKQIDHIHPLKLSNNKSWQSRLWHEAMAMQIEQIRKYQVKMLQNNLQQKWDQDHCIAE